MNMGVLPVSASVYHVRAWCPHKPEEGIGSPGSRVTDFQMEVSCDVGVGIKPGSFEKAAIESSRQFPK